MSSDDTTNTNQYRYSAVLARDIESKWQRAWAEGGAFDVANPVGKLSGGALKPQQRKFYVLDMFPYASGVGLHVGHPLGYIGSDVYARFMRMKGHTVLHPFGFDAFGLQTEQYAIETGQHPATTTTQNIDNMRRQLKRLGLAHDPRREISTADPAYYRWTQWIFLQIFNSWCDPATGRARPIADLIGEFEAGIRAPVSSANPSDLPWWVLDATTGPGSSTPTGWPIWTRRRSIGVRASVRSWRTKKSLRTGAPTSEITRCTAVECGNGC
jgi:leucyl-tRNA synthetase